MKERLIGLLLWLVGLLPMSGNRSNNPQRAGKSNNVPIWFKIVFAIISALALYVAGRAGFTALAH